MGARSGGAVAGHGEQVRVLEPQVFVEPDRVVVVGSSVEYRRFAACTYAGDEVTCEARRESLASV